MSAIDSASLNSFETLADWGAWLVIIGVAGEGIEIVLKVLKHELPKGKFADWSNKHELGIEIWGALFWLMVVAGLAMEFRYGHKAKTITDAENVRLTQNAADLNLKAEVFRLKAATLEQQILEIGITNAQLSLRVEELRSNNIVLSAKLLPRTITPSQRDILMRLLKPKSDEEICFTYETSIDEEKKYAESLGGILQQAGFKLMVFANPVMIDRINEGLIFSLREDSNSLNAETIKTAFEEAKIPGIWQSLPPSPLPGPALTIRVGRKPTGQ